MAIRAYGASIRDPDTWQSATFYPLETFVVPTTPNGYCYESVVEGTSGTTEPEWPETPGNTAVDGDQEEGPFLTWICRELLFNPLEVTLDTEGFGGYSLKDIWCRADGEAEFTVFGSYDGLSWRQIDEISVPQGNRDNRHKGLQNAYRFIKVSIDSDLDSEIEIVAGGA